MSTQRTAPSRHGVARHTGARLGVIALVVSAAVVVSGCASAGGRRTPGHERGHYGGTLRVLTSLPGQSIDPAVDDDNNWLILTMTNDGLTNFKRVGGRAGLQMTADLASSVPRPTDHGRTYRFHLRRGIRFSNGRLLTPDDVTSTFERMFKVGSPGASLYSDVLGAQACFHAPQACRLDAGVAADDRRGTVTFRLTQPDPTFPMRLALPFAYVLPRGTSTRPAGVHPLPATGPYMIQDGATSNETLLVRNPRFHQWSAAAQPDGYPDRIQITYRLSLEAEVTAVEQGRADYMSDEPPPDRLSEVADRYPRQVHIGTSPYVYYLALGVDSPPFDDVRVRRALNFAVDRDAIVKLWGGPGLATPTCQVLPPGLPSYRPYCPYTVRPGPGGAGRWKGPDLPRARRLIAASGTAGQSIRLYTTTDPPSQAVAAYLVGLLQSLGYRARAVALDPQVQTPYVETRRNHVQAAWVWAYADYPDPSEFLRTLVGCQGIAPPDSASSTNVSGLCVPSLRARTDRAFALEGTHPTAAARLWTELDRATTDRAPWVPAFAQRVITFLSARTGHYVYNQASTGGFLMDQAWVR